MLEEYETTSGVKMSNYLKAVEAELGKAARDNHLSITDITLDIGIAPTSNGIEVQSESTDRIIVSMPDIESVNDD